jgi:GH35 family endo-1,4-beta-xylanase
METFIYSFKGIKTGNFVMKNLIKLSSVVILMILPFLQQSAHAQTEGLKDIYANYFRFGTILNSTTVNNALMKTIVLREFNSITPENELKPDATMVQAGSTDTDIKVSLSRAANILKFCEDNNIPVRGHTLVWHSQTPAWFFRVGFNANGPLADKATMDKRMESYIKNIFAAIKNQYPNLNIYAYDVVNEAFAEDGKLRTAGTDQNSGQSPWTQIYGNDEFILNAFKYARMYAPANTKLFYNDYNEYTPAKRDAIYDLAMKLKTDGNIDGIGMQSHLDYDQNYKYPDPTLYGQVLKKFAQTGLEIQVTELDITTANTDNFAGQAKRYEDIMKEIIKYKDNVTAVVVWGIQDNQSWRSSGKPLLFNDLGNKKPAYNSIAALIPQSEWGSGGEEEETPPGGSCGDYKESFCGGIAFENVLDNSTSMPYDGECIFIADFEVIQPTLNSTVLINGVENVCGDEWSTCGYNERPAKADNGYYVYVKNGSINSWQDNGWQGIVAGSKPVCSTTSNQLKESSLNEFSIHSIGNGLLRLEAPESTILEIFDINGKKIAHFNVFGSETIKLSLKAGIYIAKMHGSSSILFPVF